MGDKICYAQLWVAREVAYLGSQKAREKAGQNAGGSAQACERPAKRAWAKMPRASGATSEALRNLIQLPHGCLEPGYLHMRATEGKRGKTNNANPGHIFRIGLQMSLGRLTLILF